MRITKFSILIVLCLFISLSNICNAQQTSEPSGMHWLIGLNFSADYCNQSGSENDESRSGSNEETHDQLEYAKFGYTTGLTAEFVFSSKFSIESGLQFSNKGFNQELFFGDFVDPRYGFVYETQGNIDESFMRRSFHYLDIPVRILFRTGKKKLSFISSIGFTTNILLGTKETLIIKYEDGGKKVKEVGNFEDEEYETLNISPLVSAGVTYKLNDKFSLRAEPTLRYGVLKITDTPVSKYLWNCGLNFSCVYAL